LLPETVNQPTPALVTERAAVPLPRLPLWLLCAAYVLPGVFGRDPWRNADITAYGLMLGMAEGRTPWLQPALGGWPPETALLPHWLGALAIRALPWLDPVLAARLPFAALLGLTLVLLWYATFHLARTEAAQPVAFAFGGEAAPVDYARALADGAVLAMIAALGLLQLGHETTPELVQLSEVALLLWALAAAPWRGTLAHLVAALALVALALSGAPTVATVMGGVALVTGWRSGHPGVRAQRPWLLAGVLAAAGLAALFGSWHWRAAWPDTPARWLGIARMQLWFCWPLWPLALLTLWRWRRHLLRRHIATPLGTVIVAQAAMVVMGGLDRALLLSLPGLAVLAAFALPTLQRGTSAAIDWFSVFFFSGSAVLGWVIYLSMQTGVPPQPLANILRLAPGFVPRFSLLPLLLAALGTLCWLWLVRWRTARHRHPLWKSLVLPASGVALAWLLAMTLWLPPLDYARSPRALVDRIAAVVPPGACVLGPHLFPGQVAALEIFGHYRVLPQDVDAPDCDVLILQQHRDTPVAQPTGWTLAARVQHPVDRVEQTWVFRRQR
jgi:hypothetical protein